MVDMDNDEIHLNSFNSNWTCECKRKTAKPETSRQHKLVLNYKSQTDSLFQSPGDEFFTLLYLLYFDMAMEGAQLSET